MIMDEIWKKIEWARKYSVSNLGRVRNDETGHILSQTIRSKTSNYLAVALRTNAFGREQKTANVHALVAEAFLGKPQQGLEINHIDGNKHNNVVDNLEWVTKSENSRHAFDLGLRKSTSAQVQKAIDATKRKVVNLTLGIEYESIAEAGRAIGGNGHGISKCLSGERKTYYGMRFAYADK